MKGRTPLVAFALVALIAAVLAWFAMRDTADSRASAAPAATALIATPAPAEPAPPDEIASERDAPAGAALESVEPAVSAGEPEPIATEATLITLYGFVRAAESGAALDGEVNVSVVDRLGTWQNTRASSDGAYSISGLVPGDYWIRAGSIRAGAANTRIALAVNESERRLDLQLVLAPQVLVKLIDRAGAPLAKYETLAVATLEPPGEWFEEVFGSFNNPFGVGHFWQNGYASERLPDGYLGKLILDVEPPLYVSIVHWQCVVATQRVERGQAEVEFVLDRELPALQSASVRVRFVDAADGTPLATGSVELDGNSMRMLRPEAGGFGATNIAPGWYELVAKFSGYEGVLRRVLIEPGIENDLGEVRLGREVWIAGVVTDATGAAVAADVDIRLFDEATAKPVRHFVGRGASTEADGSFKIPGLSRARYMLRLRQRDSTWALTSRLVDARNGPVEDVRFELVPGVALVVRPSSDAWRDVRFDVLDANEQLVTSSRLWFEAPQPLLLAPGSYTVVVRANELAEPRRIPVTIANEPVELPLP